MSQDDDFHFYEKYGYKYIDFNFKNVLFFIYIEYLCAIKRKSFDLNRKL